MSERFKELVLKTSDAAMHRGFESHPLRQFPSVCIHHGEIPKWWRGSPAKGVGLERVARVQIPLSPPDVKCPRCVKIKHLGHFSYVWNRKNFPISEENFRILKLFSSQSHTRAHECTRMHTKARKKTAHNQVYHGSYSFNQKQCKCVNFVTFPLRFPHESVPSFLFSSLFPFFNWIIRKPGLF